MVYPPFWGLFIVHVASFLRFMHAKVRLTCILTLASPRYWVYRMPCFSLASANTRSIVSFRFLYSAFPSGVLRICSAAVTNSCQICRLMILTWFWLPVHFFTCGQSLHIFPLLRYSRYPLRSVVPCGSCCPPGQT